MVHGDDIREGRALGSGYGLVWVRRWFSGVSRGGDESIYMECQGGWKMWHEQVDEDSCVEQCRDGLVICPPQTPSHSHLR